jgi:hypothetical protein
MKSPKAKFNWDVFLVLVFSTALIGAMCGWLVGSWLWGLGSFIFLLAIWSVAKFS